MKTIWNNSPFALGSILVGTFACGFLCAWLVKSGESPPAPEAISAKGESRPPRRMTPDRRKSPAMSNADTRIATLLNDGQDWQPGPDEDYPCLLETLQRRARLSGLELRGELLLSRIVTSWYDADPDAAFSWVLGIGKPKDEGELLGEIAANCELGADFPFRIALEGLASDYWPPSLLDEWARRDFASAWEWSYENINSPKQLSGMVEAWSKKVGNDEFAEFAASLMDESHWDPEVAKRRKWGREQWRSEHMLIVREMLTSRPSPDRFRSLLELVSDRQESLNRLIRVGASLNVPSAQRYREELLKQMTPDERMAAFESFDLDVRRVTQMRGYYRETLTLLGHSREEIDRMVPTEISD